MSRGKFITIDGLEGAGKSTQIDFIKKYLSDRNRDFFLTREPGGTDLGEQLRALLLDKNIDAMNPDTELLLMFAARNEHVKKVICQNWSKESGSLVIALQMPHMPIKVEEEEFH